MKPPFFYNPNIEETLQLTEEESKHALKSLRLKAGDPIRIINGKGKLIKAQILSENKRGCEVEIIEAIEDFGKRDFKLFMAVAPTKNNNRYEWFLEKATELGLDSITPLLCTHSERKKIKPERYERILTAAIKQSEKALLPSLQPLTSFTDFIQHEFSGQKFIATCEDISKEKLKEAYKVRENALILIGPEGDFTNEEIQLAIDNDFIPVSLGESRLRTETAAVIGCHTIHLLN